VGIVFHVREKGGFGNCSTLIGDSEKSVLCEVTYHIMMSNHDIISCYIHGAERE
jgi:hypothetical protein